MKNLIIIEKAINHRDTELKSKREGRYAFFAFVVKQNYSTTHCFLCVSVPQW